MKARHYLVSVSALAIALACGWLVNAVKRPPGADDLVLTLLLLWLHHDVATHKLVGMLSICFLLLFALSVLSTEGRVVLIQLLILGIAVLRFNRLRTSHKNFQVVGSTIWLDFGNSEYGLVRIKTRYRPLPK
jgi:hypothetical protein